MNEGQLTFDTIGVIGHTGMVGGATFRYFQKLGKTVYGYSRREPNEEALKADLVFVCVPTPYVWEEDKRGFSDVAITDILTKIVTVNPDAIVCIKSTVRIGTCNKMQDAFPTLHILFNPEFLSEASNDTDFANPDRQYIGYTEQSYKYATPVLNILPESPYGVILPIKEAELLKYINNMHGILSVIESNHFYDVCQLEGLDYERVTRASEASKWVGAPMGRQYHTIFHKGFRGVGGKCFPKDINAWVDYCKDNKLDVRLLDSALQINKDLLSAQGMTEAQAEART